MPISSPLRAAPRTGLEALITVHPFKPYRQYRAFSRRAQRDILLGDVDTTLAVAGEFSQVLDGPSPRAAVLARPLPWDSDYFGLSMGRLDAVLTTPDATIDDRRVVIDGALAAARAQGVQHLTARVDIGDLETLGVLEAAGFRTMDVLATYMLRLGIDTPRAVRRVGHARPARPDDAAALIDITRDAYAGYRGRFHLDPHIDPRRADGFYVEWARQAVAGTMANFIMVSEDADGRVIGYLTMRQRQPAPTVPTLVYGSGLGACRRDAPGAYASIIHAAALRAAAEHPGAVAECQTQVANFAVIRVYESVGFRLARAEFTLHAWLGRP